MKKFIGKLFTFVLYAGVIGLLVKAGYDMFGEPDKIKRETELADRLENYVPEEVSPYIENPNEYMQYYYKSIGGDFYLGQRWEMEGIPSYVTMSGDDFEERDITEYFSYDEKVYTFIIAEELLSTLGNGYHHICVYYADETFEEFGFQVEDELVNNVPALLEFRSEARTSRIYNRLSDVQELSLYYSNIGDNRIVDVLEYNEGSILGLVDPKNYVVSSAGNKVTLKEEYLQSLKPNTKKEYGVRLADGTIVYEPWINFWTVEDEWAGCVFKDVKDYSLSEGGDYAINLKRNDTQKILMFKILDKEDENIEHVFVDIPDWHGHEYMEKFGNTITIPEDVMKTLPVDKELTLFLYYYFDYDNNVWCDERVTFKVVQ